MYNIVVGSCSTVVSSELLAWGSNYYLIITRIRLRQSENTNSLMEKLFDSETTGESCSGDTGYVARHERACIKFAGSNKKNLFPIR